MSLESALDAGREALTLVLILSTPILMIGLAVGLTVSVLQAVTQLQEQTLSFVPKILAMIVAASLFVPWISQKLMDYTVASFTTPWRF
jgi:flagellar biosynthetic protein FliQ